MAEKKEPNLIKDLEARYKNEKQLSELKIKMLEVEKGRLGNILDVKRRINIEQEITNERQNIINSMIKAQNDALDEGFEISLNTTNALGRRIEKQKELMDNQKMIIKNKETMLKYQTKIVNLAKQLGQYLMDQDRIIKSTILSLGLSGEKADEMRLSFEESAGLVARLGGNLEDIQTIMTGFADETGRARILSSQMIKDIYVIGKGTAIGVENATRLASQFELMGMDARSTMEYVQGVVETSELMGVNTTKVLNNITDQFKKLQRYTFRRGVQGFAEMAMYAEKFNMDMGQALDSAEMSRNLEHAIDLAANLQVLGGEFAKTDPFQLLFQARNEPEEYAKSLNKMTKGMATYRKLTDGTYQNFISPADIDRLTQAEKSLGLQTGELTKQARRMSELQRMRTQMVGMGLSKTEKKLVEGMSIFSTKTGRFTVEIAGATKDMAELTANDLKVLEKHNESLEERAMAAQTFDEVYKATIDEFKTVLLPMLKGINRLLEWLRPTVIKITEALTKGSGAWIKVAGTIMGAAVLIKAASIGLAVANAKILNRFAPILSSGGMKATGSQMVGKGKMATGMGKGAMGAGVGVGAAAVGIGGGIALAAVGISKLADSMSKLTKEQADVLNNIVNSLLIFTGFAVVMIGMIAALGATATAASLGLLAFGGAVLMVGAGIGIAAAGIGYMGEGLAKLNESGEGIGEKLWAVAGGIVGITAAMVKGGAPALFAFDSGLKKISKRSEDIEKIGTAFTAINTVLSGSKDDFLAVQNAIVAISNANFDNLKPLTQLKNILNKPLQVEFANKEVEMVSNITLNIDGYAFHEATNTAGYVQSKLHDSKNKNALKPTSV